MARLERNLRETLSGWRFWMAFAYFGLVCIVVALFALYGRQSHEEATRAASARAAATTQVGQCFTAVNNAPVTNGFIDAHEAIIQNGLITNRVSLAVSAPNDPLRQVRLDSIVRLQKAEKNVGQLRRLIHMMTPTRAKCVSLAHMLNVDTARYLAKEKR